jgi:hypothetical protein
MKILLLALMVGCASGPSLSELEDQYFECTRDGAVGCDEIAAEIDRRYELKKMRADRRKAERERRCRSGRERRCRSGGATCLEGEAAKDFGRRMQESVRWPN